MQTNSIPHYDLSDNRTGCCPRFHPGGWDGLELHFEEKPFVRAESRSIMHIPLNMGRVFGRVQEHIEEAGGSDDDNYLVLSEDPSPWKSVHLIASDDPVPDEEMTTLSGDFVTKVFEGPYRDAGKWASTLKAISAERGKADGRAYFFYTTCPRCAKAYGENYVVGFAEV